jgi:GDPmannose 4,6-dehydratase/GDP-4-dehydro-6-deoxy-D-mannose reductase
MSRKFKRCLITGITGSGGSYLAEFILKVEKKIKIYGFYRSNGYLKFLNDKYKNRIKFIKVDLKNFKNIKKYLKIIRPDLIFHLASDADVKKSFDYPIENAKNNNLITINLLEAVRKAQVNPVIIICSSSEVYGNVIKKNMPISENFPIMPINPYAATKAYQDLISQIYQKTFGLKIIITRMFSYTNARRGNLFQTAFARQIAMIENNKKKTLFHGNLKSIRTFIDIEDAMNAYWLTAKKGKIGEIYNIGGKTTISVKKYLFKLIKMARSKIVCKKKSELIRPKDITLQIPNVAKFKKHTGWIEKVSFNKSINKLLEESRNYVKKK